MVKILKKNNERQKKVCIVGCGTIARVHARQLRNIVQLSFVSRDRERTLVFADSYGGGKVYDNYEEALDDSNDAVVLCTPPSLHTNGVLKALSAGKGVLVEKPLCLSITELDDLVKASKNNPEILLMIAENYYYKPSLHLLRDFIEDGIIGRLEFLKIRKCFTQNCVGWKRHYGALLEGGIHFIALISGLINRVPKSINAVFPGAVFGEPERHSQVTMFYDHGIEAQLEYSWNTPSKVHGLFQHSYLQGSEGRIVFESNGLYVWLHGRKRYVFRFPSFSDTMGYNNQAQDFIACLNEPGRLPKSGLNEAWRDLNVVFKSYEQLQEQIE